MEEKGKILIIDDNEDVLFALNLLLEPYMEQIRVTTQPTRIEHFMTTFHPDVILLDMNFQRDAHRRDRRRAISGGSHGVSCAHCPHRLGITKTNQKMDCASHKTPNYFNNASRSSSGVVIGAMP